MSENDPKKEIWAPHTSVFNQKTGGDISFEIYFLRDLYNKGKIDAKLIRDLAKQNGLDESHVEEALKALESPASQAVPKALSSFMASIAQIIGSTN